MSNGCEFGQGLATRVDGLATKKDLDAVGDELKGLLRDIHTTWRTIKNVVVIAGALATFVLSAWGFFNYLAPSLSTSSPAHASPAPMLHAPDATP